MQMLVPPPTVPHPTRKRVPVRRQGWPDSCQGLFISLSCSLFWSMVKAPVRKVLLRCNSINILERESFFLSTEEVCRTAKEICHRLPVKIFIACVFVCVGEHVLGCSVHQCVCACVSACVLLLGGGAGCLLLVVSAMKSYSTFCALLVWVSAHSRGSSAQ